MSLTRYYVGGFLPNAPAQNRAEQYDDQAQTVTAWDKDGNATATRPYTAGETARAVADSSAAAVDSNRTSLQGKAEAALTVNATFLAIASPTNAQIAAQVKLLTRENNALIRLALGLLDDTSGT